MRTVGYLDENKWRVNTSTILSKLIVEAGTLCKNYASDLFIDWANIHEAMESGEPIHKKWMFGFRENGVDGAQMIEARFENPEIYGNPYARIYELYVDTHDANITMELVLFKDFT